jgi:hypothetical protein
MAEIRPRLNEEEWKLIQQYRERYKGLTAECEQSGLPAESVDHGWLKTKEWSLHFKTEKQDIDYLAAIKDIVQTYHPEPVKVAEQKETGHKALKVTISDAHVGMETNPNGEGLFSYEYSADIFNRNLDKVFASVLNAYNLHGRFDLLLIQDLGDGLDGWNGETTRGGHKLDQNMTNPEAFKAYVLGKLSLYEKCIRADIANKVIFRNVANCNHAGDFGEIANATIQMMIERTYGKEIEFDILTRFMEHFEYGNHTFILTHGKDKKHMKHGLPYQLNDKTIKFITEYIDHYEINTKYIHVEKGDLHKIGYERTAKFDYRNYMSFAPPSSWVQTNFGSSYSGYSIQVVPKYSNDIAHTDYFFDLKKLKKIA